MMPNAPPPEPSDEDLATRRELGPLYERYARRLTVFLSRLGVASADLDDLQQDVWVRVWNQFAAGRFDGHFRGWLFQIARNRVIDYLRRKRPEALPEDLTLPAGAPGPDDHLARQEDLEQLRRCIDRLSEQQAAVVRGRLAGEASAAIGQRLGITPERAHRLYHDAGKALALCMKRASR
jgi:RNA polymerase sigma-70 factor (ECF subfamily)